MNPDKWGISSTFKGGQFSKNHNLFGSIPIPFISRPLVIRLKKTEVAS